MSSFLKFKSKTSPLWDYKKPQALIYSTKIRPLELLAFNGNPSTWGTLGIIKHSKHTFYFELPGREKGIDFLRQKGLPEDISLACKSGGETALRS